MAGVVAPVTLALRRAVARTIHESPPILAWSGPAVLVLSGDLQVQAQTSVTEDYLRGLVPPEGDRRPIPAGAYNVAAQLLAVEAGVDDHPPLMRVHLDSGVWLTLRAARVDAACPPGDRDIAVTIEATSPAERRRLFASSHGLSPRERELVELLAHGADTHTIAEKMFLSEHTVQDHFKSVFAKTGTRNRRSLLARLVGGGPARPQDPVTSHSDTIGCSVSSVRDGE